MKLGLLSLSSFISPWFHCPHSALNFENTVAFPHSPKTTKQKGRKVLPPGLIIPHIQRELIRIKAGRGLSNSNFLGINDDDTTCQTLEVGSLKKILDKAIHEQWAKTSWSE